MKTMGIESVEVVGPPDPALGWHVQTFTWREKVELFFCKVRTQTVDGYEITFKNTKGGRMCVLSIKEVQVNVPGSN